MPRAPNNLTELRTVLEAADAIAGAETMKTINELAASFLEAVTAETMAYRQSADDGLADETADALTMDVIAAERALLAVPREVVDAEMRESGDMDYVLALALAHRRWLIMDAGYQSRHQVTECRLVDTLLSMGDKFSTAPLLWHLNGEPRTERPSDSELEHAWEADQ